MEFKVPPLIGLKNVGAQCFMNATLQCLLQIESLVNYFKYQEKLVVKKKFKGQIFLAKSFKILIENLWPTNGNKHLDQKFISKNSNNAYFIPEEFNNKIKKMNPLFKSYQANDGEDLINFIIMTLHEELNKSKVDTNNFNNKNPTNEPLMLNDFLIRFSKENCSIISDIFYGAEHSICRCSSCLKQTHNFYNFFFLSFPLEEVREYKLKLLSNQNNMMTNQNEANKFLNQNFVMNNMMNNQIFQQNMIKIQFLQNNNQVNIYDCFDFIQKEENLTGKNSMFCDACKICLPHTYASYLYSTPNILILVLKRETRKLDPK